MDQSIHFVTLEEAAAWDEKQRNSTFHKLNLNQKNETNLKEICAFCRENGIELTAVVVPYPNYLNIYRLADYAAITDELKNLFAAYGFSYLDFNLTRESSFSLSGTDYHDVGHLNSSGAAKFSRFLGTTLKSLDAGEEVTDLFYNPWEFAHD